MGVDKSVVRQLFMTKRHQLDPILRETASQFIVDFLTQLPEYSTSKTVALYAASHGEASLRRFFDRCISDGKSCYFPRLEEDYLVFHQVAAWTELTPGAYGILAPLMNRAVLTPAHCDMMVVPGVAFDRAGSRLGRGKGYYDRYLPMVGGCHIGVCLEAFVVESLPVESHDARMHLLVTESGVLRFNSPPPLGEG